MRADTLKKSASAESKGRSAAAQKRAAQGTLDEAQAAVRDAQFDLGPYKHCRAVHRPHRQPSVSVGNLVAGSRAAPARSTLLATLVSTDQIYLNFDMSEADYMTFLSDARESERTAGRRAKIASPTRNL